MEKSIQSPVRAPRAPCRAVGCALAATLLAAGTAASAQGIEPWAQQVQQLASQTAAPMGARVEVEVGSIDPRLTLAPCARITPYLPAGTRLWGRARVGLRCDEGARWNVSVPVTVKVFADAWTVNQALPAGTVLQAAHLQRGEADLAAEPSPVLREPQAAIGRTLARTLRPGQPVREADLKVRQWFAAGDTVRIVSNGAGFAISADGQALGAGIDGQIVKVRIDGGRVVSGRAVGERRIEVML
ncbi:MAG TPA: flagellar basal body P-ring formation chaperone FlgA [Burkholderiaceae bacterium]|nr:flagellar basal body P-ring formation chaperone FlgA [Burkholderiaceae bacterium]